MVFENKPLDKIQESDIKQLLNDQIRESKTLDYKRDAIGRLDTDKKEFLADISSFANAAGGNLILGIGESNGIPVELTGIQVSNVDNEVSHLDSLTRDGIAPRVSGLGIQPIKINSPKLTVIAIRIPQSFALPHMVRFKEHNKFYSRNSNGKYLVDISELRNLFLLSESAFERIRKFREERLSMIKDKTIPSSVPLVNLR